RRARTGPRAIADGDTVDAVVVVLEVAGPSHLGAGRVNPAGVLEPGSDDLDGAAVVAVVGGDVDEVVAERAVTNDELPEAAGLDALGGGAIEAASVEGHVADVHEVNVMVLVEPALAVAGAVEPAVVLEDAVLEGEGADVLEEHAVGVAPVVAGCAREAAADEAPVVGRVAAVAAELDGDVGLGVDEVTVDERDVVDACPDGADAAVDHEVAVGLAALEVDTVDVPL